MYKWACGLVHTYANLAEVLYPHETRSMVQFPDGDKCIYIAMKVEICIGTYHTWLDLQVNC